MLNDKLIDKSQKLHNEAKNGILNYLGKKYVFNFDRYSGVYEVIEESGEIETRLNTRKITIAKQWFKEWLQN